MKRCVLSLITLADMIRSLPAPLTESYLILTIEAGLFGRNPRWHPTWPMPAALRCPDTRTHSRRRDGVPTFMTSVRSTVHVCSSDQPIPAKRSLLAASGSDFRSRSVLAYDTLRLAWLPDRNVHMATADLHSRRAGQVGRIEVVEVLSPEVEPGVVEKCRGKPLM